MNSQWLWRVVLAVLWQHSATVLLVNWCRGAKLCPLKCGRSVLAAVACSPERIPPHVQLAEVEVRLRLTNQQLDLGWNIKRPVRARERSEVGA